MTGLTALGISTISNEADNIFEWEQDISFICRLKWLQELSACGNNIGPEGARHIGELCSLKYLNLSANPIRDEGMQFISQLTKLR
jgi:hypothetical protein